MAYQGAACHGVDGHRVREDHEHWYVVEEEHRPRPVEAYPAPLTLRDGGHAAIRRGALKGCVRLEATKVRGEAGTRSAAQLCGHRTPGSNERRGGSAQLVSDRWTKRG